MIRICKKETLVTILFLKIDFFFLKKIEVSYHSNDFQKNVGGSIFGGGATNAEGFFEIRKIQSKSKIEKKVQS